MGGVLAAGGSAIVAGGCASPVASKSSTCGRIRFKLGIARFTFWKVELEKALGIMKEIDCHYSGLMSRSIRYDAGDAEIAAYKANLAKYDVETVSAGPEYFKTKEQAEALFAFAKRWGMKYVSVVPYAVCPGREDKFGPGNREESEEMLDVLESLVRKYDIKAAIHNHGPDIPTLYPTAEAIWARIKDRDKRIGICFDIGHQQRSGLDPVAAIRKYGERIYEVHLKNITRKDSKGRAIQGPRGVLDIPAIFKALADVGFDGFALIEYERDYENNAMGLAESLGYYRGVIDVINAS
jgi:sugar phosphate isomerase/epimerase